MSAVTDLAGLLRSGVPLMDVRAPVEFAKGAFPAACNLPLMNDIERQKVGTCYKQHGQHAAIELGHQLVGGAVKRARVAAWAAFAQQHPDGVLYCFRGGLRSRIVQQWLQEAGVQLPYVEGGYKALRTVLIDTTEQAVAQCHWVVLGGMTGTGKTEVLATLDQALDLEGHAHHRGSSFGKHATAQPGQIDFENRLALDLLRQRSAGARRFVVEDEARLVGACSLPLSLHRGMLQAPLVWLEDSLAGRVARIVDDYVVKLCAEFVALHGPEAGPQRFAERLRQSLDNIVKRLGHARHRQLSKLMAQALAVQQSSGDVSAHCAWIEALLVEYYDPMYAYQRRETAHRVLFRGERAAVTEFLQHWLRQQG
ncbi:tRNA 2-selenouridine(34) synthase MnmH [Isoalcanivorax beigongshangi]|uniref:tRNA 2-selenouridine synthase n=1 Tax=Isoalcanivorax beigongshangi TaxID=3238810 RepID=A0ABV4AE96_9GAMM